MDQILDGLIPANEIIWGRPTTTTAGAVSILKIRTCICSKSSRVPMAAAAGILDCGAGQNAYGELASLSLAWFSVKRAVYIILALVLWRIDDQGH
ncbi:hypothetical protein [Aminobacter ciceronei]|uniref:Uncharacterized protein n=1 Tax=Aminobacter ciceronei TaxID=150723 RepID=A0ABR6C9W2_9HYPH|nr:hypothetical protein [Aminobacter ciceronei]MBA8907524.1 hypothetical protein [Aminobacter ciceronei]MBA9021375.1 hypothetical protein [Aminobacter ciceronei]